jgi:hypothetical protein
MNIIKTKPSLVLFLYLVLYFSAVAVHADSGMLPARRLADASVDRNLLVPAAETIPAKTWAFNSYEIFFAGFTYGISDNLQISCTGLLPIFKDQPLIIAAMLKSKIVQGKKFIFSLQAGGQFTGYVGEDDLGSLSLGAFLDYIPDSKGKLVLSLGVQGFLSRQKIWDYNNMSEWQEHYVTEFACLPSLSINFRAGRRIKLFGELLMPRGDEDTIYGFAESSFFAAYGIRFFSSKIAVELSFIRPLGDDELDIGDALLIGIPLLTFSVRF